MKTLNHLSILLLALLCSLAANAEFDPTTETQINAAINGDHRSAEDKARDIYRKPYEALEFLGLTSDMTVVEIWPGGGWYTKILAPTLQQQGKLYTALFDLNGANGFERRSNGSLLTTLGSTPELYGDVEVTELALPFKLNIAPAGSADMVLTFRSVHNFVMDLFGGGAYADLAFEAMYKALKPGGILGVVDHKWDDPSSESPNSENGYISVQRTLELATNAGFVLVEQSSLLANPKDTKDYGRGVWSLPPSYAFGDQDREIYSAIGESDRFLLKFIKPMEEE